jgi:hypothetical protein
MIALKMSRDLSLMSSQRLERLFDTLLRHAWLNMPSRIARSAICASCRAKASRCSGLLIDHSAFGGNFFFQQGVAVERRVGYRRTHS